MAVKIRLARHGRKGRPFYHIVAADSRAPRDGKFIEKLGTYNPMTTPATTELNFDRALYWLETGAQPTDSAKSILSKEGVMLKKHLNGGIRKGAFDEATAETKFQEWLEGKRKQTQAILDKKVADAEKQEAERIEAEKKVNQERAERIAKKNSEMVAEAKDTEETAEAPAEENTDTTEAAE